MSTRVEFQEQFQRNAMDIVDQKNCFELPTTTNNALTLLEDC